MNFTAVLDMFGYTVTVSHGDNAEQCSDESSSVSMGICQEQLLLGQNLTTSTSDTDAEHNSEDEEEVYLEGEVAHTLNCEISYL